MSLTVDTIYFEGFAVTPAYNFKTGELGSALIVYTVTNVYQQVAHGEVRLTVTLNGDPIEKILLLNLDPLLVGKMGVPYNYSPTQGWQQGTYGFSLQLYIDGQLYTSSKERNLTAGKTDVSRSRKGPRLGILGRGKSGKAGKQSQKAKVAESKAAAGVFSVEDVPEEDNAEDTAAEPRGAGEAIDIAEATSVKKEKVGPGAGSTTKKGKWWKRIGGLGKKREDRGHVSAEVTDAGDEVGGEEEGVAEEVGFAEETDLAEQTVPSATGGLATESSVPEASEAPEESPETSDAVEEIAAIGATGDVEETEELAEAVDAEEPLTAQEASDAVREAIAKWADGDVKQTAGPAKAVDAGKRPAVSGVTDAAKEVTATGATVDARERVGLAEAFNAGKRPAIPNMSDFMKEYTPPQSTSDVKKASVPAKAVDIRKRPTVSNMNDFMKEYTPPQSSDDVKKASVPVKAPDVVKAPTSPEASDVVKRYVPPQPTGGVKETASPAKAVDTVKHAEVAKVTDAAKRIEPAAAGSQATAGSAPKVIEPWKWSPAIGGSRREGIVTKSTGGVKETADAVKKYVPPQPIGGAKETASPAKAVDTVKPPTAPKVSAAVTGGSAGQATGAVLRSSILRLTDMGQRAVPPAPGGTVGGQIGGPVIEPAREAMGTRVADAGKEEKMAVGADKERFADKPAGIDKESAAVKAGDAEKGKAGGEVSGGQKSTDGPQVSKGKSAKTTSPIRFLNR